MKHENIGQLNKKIKELSEQAEKERVYIIELINKLEKQKKEIQNLKHERCKEWEKIIKGAEEVNEDTITKYYLKRYFKPYYKDLLVFFEKLKEAEYDTSKIIKTGEIGQTKVKYFLEEIGIQAERVDQEDKSLYKVHKNYGRRGKYNMPI